MLWLFPFLIAGILGLVFGIAVAAAIHMPGVNSLSSFQPGLITHVRDSHGQVFATYARERRMMLRDGQVPKLLQEAVVAIEDAGFFHHGGIDAVGVLRAALTDLRTGHFTQGASTITMQLARHLFLSRKKTWRRKVEEAFLAVELEKTFSKQQILTMYCNLIFLGHGNYGMEAAAHDYFNKSVDELDLPESATLAGIAQQPSRFNPFRNPELVVRRRNEVLRRMLSVGYIDKARYETAVATPLLLAVHKPQNDLGRYFSEEVRQDLEKRYGTDAVLSKGLDVETTLDTEIQRAAQGALRQGLLTLDHGKGWRGPLYHLKQTDLTTQQLPSWSKGSLTPGSWNEGIVLTSNHSRATVRIGDQTFSLDGDGIAWTHHSRPSDILKKGDVAWFRLLPATSGQKAGHLELEQQPELEGAVLVIESATGAVRALVGGWDFDRSKFDRAIQAHRQVGSAFKPFVYGAAIESGFTPADTLFDGPVVFPNADNQLVYSPRNFYRKYYGIVTLRRALEESINVTSVKLLDLVGAHRVI
ncbi:MAG TPA: transglycosylase domain-containing protein, partial [Thermoanaerobaculia bacterium]|nr:transglycosylase domain-containing protein [Thermoanaerobaculia bacterium]